MKPKENDPAILARRQQEQMLKLVTKGFYNELVNYGVAKPDIVTIASHLLDNIMQQGEASSREGKYYQHLFTTRSVQDEWKEHKRLSLETIRLEPLREDHLRDVAQWVSQPNVRESFVAPFPERAEDLVRYFAQPGRLYFSIASAGELVGIIGAENIDRPGRRLEMRKLVGSLSRRGQGIGKRATFTFLYYVFKILQFDKVYIHSTDVNIRNLNLNSRFGFQLEGVFLQEILREDARQDVVRMGLLRRDWLQLYDGPP